MKAPRVDNFTALWTGLRLVALDIETLMDEQGRHRIISLGVVPCLGGQVSSADRASWTINPGIPVDPDTQRVHGIRDADLAGHPPFEERVLEVISKLAGRFDERVVFVAHQARFDIPVLLSECQPYGGLPNFRVLDTMGPILAHLDVTGGNSLAAVAAALGITNPAPHEALGDALTTALIACRLLERAADAGYSDIEKLLADIKAPRVYDLTFAGPTRRRERAVAEPGEISASHAKRHARILPRTLGPRLVTAWEKDVRACAEQRCPFLAPQVATAETPAKDLLPTLLRALEERAKAGDVAGAATIAGAIGHAFEGLPPVAGRNGLRRAAIDLERKLGPKLDALARCDRDDVDRRCCPSCEEGGVCGLDRWRLDLAPLVLNATPRMGVPVAKGVAKDFLDTTGAGVGQKTSVYSELRRRGCGPLADAAMRLVHAYWVEVGQEARATQLAMGAWAAGCRDPLIADAYATSVAAGGRDADLRRAYEICAEALKHRAGSTDTLWAMVSARAARYDGQLQRLDVRYSDETDAEGRPIPLRLHRPEKPRRTRPARFLRNGLSG